MVGQGRRLGLALSMLLALADASPGDGCRLHPASLHRAGRGAAVTVLYPRPFPREVLVAAAARAVGCMPTAGLPAGPAGSRVGPEASAVDRLVAAASALILLETGGIHAGPDGRPVMASAPGHPAGWMQLSERAAREAGARASELGLPGLADAGDPARLRLDWAWNLRLGTIYLAILVGRVARPGEPGGLAWLRAMAAWVGGEDQPYLAGPAATFMAGVAARPEVKRYVRQGAFALGLEGEPALLAWKAPLSGRVTRQAGGWAQEALRVRREFEALFSPCRP